MWKKASTGILALHHVCGAVKAVCVFGIVSMCVGCLAKQWFAHQLDSIGILSFCPLVPILLIVYALNASALTGRKKGIKHQLDGRLLPLVSLLVYIICLLLGFALNLGVMNKPLIAQTSATAAEKL